MLDFMPLSERLERERLDIQRNVKLDPVEPTEEEKRNGWTSKSLTKYLTERVAIQSLAVDINSLTRQKRPTEQNHTYKVHRWRE